MTIRQFRRIPAKNLWLVGIVFIIFAAVFVGIRLTSKSGNQTQTPPPDDSVFLIGQVNNFDGLTLNDLPVLLDYRMAEPYRGHILYGGLDRIIEYDPAAQRFVRASRTDSITGMVSSVVLGDTLFVATNSTSPLEELGESSKVYKIDLPTGRIIGRYLGEIADKDHRFMNPRLVVHNGNVWLSSWDGVAKYEEKTDSFTLVPLQEIFQNQDCKPSIMFSRNGYLYLVSNEYYCLNTYARLNPQTEKWETFSGEVDTVLRDAGYYRPQSVEVREIQRNGNITPRVSLPKFAVLSALIDGYYVILADDGIYRLERGKFPEKISAYNLSIDSSYDSSFRIAQMSPSYVTIDRRYLLVLGAELPEMGPAEGELKDYLIAYALDLKTWEVTDLAADNRFSHTITAAEYDALREISNELTFSENSGNVIATSPDSGEIITIGLSPLSLVLHP